MSHDTATARRPASRVRLAWTGLAAVVALAGADGAASAPADPTFVATKADGSTVAGRLRRIDAAGGVTLAVDPSETPVTIPAESLVKLARDGSEPAPPGEGAAVLFPDGDRLARCSLGPAGEATIEAQSEALGTLAVPLDAVLGLVFQSPSDPDDAWALEAKVRDEPRSTEVLWLGNGDRIEGGLLGLGEKTIAFRPATGKVELDRAGIVALGFDPKLVTYPRPEGRTFELSLVDGSRLGVTGARFEGGQLLATTRAGLAVKVPPGELAGVRVLGGAAVYLSETEPAGAKYVGYLGPTRPIRRDRAVDGRPIRLGGKVHDRGLGMQSRSYVVYRVPPGSKRFQALVGLDDGAGPLGSVAFRVVVDKEERFASPPMSSRDAPRAIDLDVSGAKTLVLIADFGERGEVRDHADWAEARLIR